MLRRCVLLLCLALTPVLLSPAYAQNQEERILRFSDIIIVNEDSSADVTEAISVFANQNKIIHGIKRQLPTRYRDSYGVTHHTNYQILQVLANEKAEDYHTEIRGDLLIIYVGNKDVTLKPGIYRFTIRYRVDNAVNFLQDADELYWNVTGNDWDFLIEKAQAYIQLPKGAEISHYSGYTGVRGAKEKNFIVNRTSEDQISFITTSPLAPGAGLTIAVAWQKGVIKQPTFWERVKNQLRTNHGQVILLEICLALLCYYLLVWYYHGRDPQKGVVMPLFDPPENLPPADMRFILHMGFDNKALSAAIVSLATKGFLRINNKDNEFSLTQLKQSNTQLSDTEKVITNDLFAAGDTLKLNKDNRDDILKTLEELNQTLVSKYQNRYFMTNFRYLIPGILLTLIAFLTAYLSVQRNADAVFALFWLTGWSIGCFILCFSAFTRIQQFVEYPTFSNAWNALFMTGFAVMFLVVEVVIFIALHDLLLFFTIPLLFIAVITNVAFYYLLKRPTEEGRALMDKILGFKMFLGATERYRLDQMNPPQKTPELFEKLLPYAMALNVETQWARQFNEVLASAQQAGHPYQPNWYAGPGFSPATIASFPAFLDSSLSSALSSASVSSSASSGSGSSGGGRGGGGGGGW